MAGRAQVTLEDLESVKRSEAGVWWVLVLVLVLALVLVLVC